MPSIKYVDIEKGIIQPSFGIKKHSSLFRRDYITGGVLTSEGLPVIQSKTVINEWEIVNPSRVNPKKIQIKYIDADAVYFCIPQNHFGHVLTGTMAFAHILLNNNYKNRKIVFISGTRHVSGPCEAIKTLLKLLDVKEENIITINEYTQFKSVAILQPSLRCARLSRFRKRLFEIDEEFIDIYKAISPKFIDDKNPRKIYFSRNKLVGKNVSGEDKIEKIFKKNGYEIFYPEQLPLNEQIKLVANADFYACVQGTLEHHSLFMKDGSTLIVMLRKNEFTERQVLINKLQKNIKHIYLQTNIRPFGDRIIPNIIGATKDLIKFFDEHKFIYDAKDLNLTNREISDYIDKCYLRSDIPLPKNILKTYLKYFFARYQIFL